MPLLISSDFLKFNLREWNGFQRKMAVIRAPNSTTVQSLFGGVLGVAPGQAADRYISFGKNMAFNAL